MIESHADDEKIREVLRGAMTDKTDRNLHEGHRLFVLLGARSRDRRYGRRRRVRRFAPRAHPRRREKTARGTLAKHDETAKLLAAALD